MAKAKAKPKAKAKAAKPVAKAVARRAQPAPSAAKQAKKKAAPKKSSANGKAAAAKKPAAKKKPASNKGAALPAAAALEPPPTPLPAGLELHSDADVFPTRDAFLGCFRSANHIVSAPAPAAGLPAELRHLGTRLTVSERDGTQHTATVLFLRVGTTPARTHVCHTAGHVKLVLWPFRFPSPAGSQASPWEPANAWLWHCPTRMGGPSQPRNNTLHVLVAPMDEGAEDGGAAAEPSQGWLYAGESLLQSSGSAMSRAEFTASPSGAPHYHLGVDFQTPRLPPSALALVGAPCVGCVRNRYGASLCRPGDDL